MATPGSLAVLVTTPAPIRAARTRSFNMPLAT
jgi:hypothetical protein